jgi:Tfp pilus assembly protein PilV
MQLNPTIPQPGLSRHGPAAFTLVEVLIASVIVVLVFGGIVNGYVLGAKRLQWSGYSLAAQTLSAQCLEQTRSAVWDLAMTNEMDITNIIFDGNSKTMSGNSTNWIITGYTTNLLDIPWKGTNYVLATNFITIKQFYSDNQTNQQVLLQSVRVDTVWPFNGWGSFQIKYYSNSICTYLAPDNRSPSTLGVITNAPSLYP